MAQATITDISPNLSDPSMIVVTFNWVNGGDSNNGEQISLINSSNATQITTAIDNFLQGVIDQDTTAVQALVSTTITYP